MREADPRFGLGKDARIDAAEDGVDETRLGRAGVLLGEFDGLVHGGMRRGAHEVELIKAEFEDRHHDRPRRLAGLAFDEVIQRQFLAETAVEKFLHERPVVGRELHFAEQFVRERAALRPAAEELESGFAGVHGRTLTYSTGVLE